MPLGFGELYRFFQRELRKNLDDFEAGNVSLIVIVVWTILWYSYNIQKVKSSLNFIQYLWKFANNFKNYLMPFIGDQKKEKS